MSVMRFGAGEDSGKRQIGVRGHEKGMTGREVLQAMRWGVSMSEERKETGLNGLQESPCWCYRCC